MSPLLKERLQRCVGTQNLDLDLIAEIEAAAEPFSEEALLCQTVGIAMDDERCEILDDLRNAAITIESLEEELTTAEKNTVNLLRATLRDLFGTHESSNQPVFKIYALP